MGSGALDGMREEDFSYIFDSDSNILDFMRTDLEHMVGHYHVSDGEIVEIEGCEGYDVGISRIESDEKGTLYEVKLIADELVHRARIGVYGRVA